MAIYKHTKEMNSEPLKATPASGQKDLNRQRLDMITVPQNAVGMQVDYISATNQIRPTLHVRFTAGNLHI